MVAFCFDVVSSIVCLFSVTCRMHFDNCFASMVFYGDEDSLRNSGSLRERLLGPQLSSLRLPEFFVLFGQLNNKGSQSVLCWDVSCSQSYLLLIMVSGAFIIEIKLCVL